MAKYYIYIYILSVTQTTLVWISRMKVVKIKDYVIIIYY